jgi:hypothetical protein
MEHTYENVAALAGRAAGPLASYLGPFVTSLINQQYAASVIYIKMTHALAFDRWVAKRGVVLADLLDAVTAQWKARSVSTRRQAPRFPPDPVTTRIMSRPSSCSH